MKKWILASLFACMLTLPFFPAPQDFIDVARPEEKIFELMMGKWLIDEGKHFFEYTDEFVCRAEGMRFFRFYTSQKPKSKEYIWTVLKSPKTGKYYLSRALYRGGRAFGFSTSIIYFIGSDRFIVMSQKNTNEVYFEAERIVNKPEGGTEN